MKKILIFSLAYLPHVGGAEVAIKEITGRIQDVEFHMLTHRFHTGDRNEERVGSVHVHRIGHGSSYFSKILFIPRAVLAAVRLHRVERFDAAWAVMSYMVIPLVCMRFLGVRIPYCLTLQEGDTFGHMFRRPHIIPILLFVRAGFRNATVVQAISKYLAAWAPRMGYRGAAIVIPNGAAVADFGREYTRAEIDALKDSLGKRMGDVFLITTSRLVPKNGIEDVLRALPNISAQVRFLILGTGPEEARLKRIANDLQVEKRVTFLGHVSHAELPKYLQASDIFIRPSLSEGMGVSFIEAMAAGLPVIASQEGGIADFLFDEKRNPDMPITGWAVDAQSPQQIAAAVEDVMRRPEKVRAVVATAKELVKEKYDWDRIATAMQEQVFRQVL